MIKKRILEKNRLLLSEAENLFVGGVNSPIRAFKYVNAKPVPIKTGCGSKVYDYDGNEYIDYVLSYGALILGHADHKIKKAVKDSIDNGFGFGATHEEEVRLARSLQKAIPFLKKIRFVNSGTEAVMGAIRLARGVTRRDKIVKFERSYHGHADYMLESKGVPKDFIKHTLIGRYKDRKSIDYIFKKYSKKIAAVIVEPVGGNDGVILPDIDFLKYLRMITKKHGTLLIFDEVITGFRFHFGSAAQLFKVKPDIICMGKIIGGGLPIGAYGGSNKIMKNLAPLGNVYQASTFAGNPVVMRAGLALMQKLSLFRQKYKKINTMTLYMINAIKKKAESYGVDIKLCFFGSMFSVHFKNKKQFEMFHRILLHEGVYFAPSEHESNFVSFAHTNKDIKKTIGACNKAFNILAHKKG